jgi:glutathione synthase
MKFGIQMDPIGGINIAGDTSFALMLEAQKRGHELFVFEPANVTYDSGRVSAAGMSVKVADVQGAHYTVLANETRPLDTLDVILIRQDPPFDTAYLANTFLLELLQGHVVMMNSPRGVRNFSEKLRALELHRYMARTFIGRSPADMRKFAAQFDQVVVKPLFLGGGASVIKTAANDPNFDVEVELLSKQVGNEPLIVQEFIPEIVEGDKRVFMIDGEVVGVLRRIPNKGDFRANIHVGGAPKLDRLTPEEEPICREVGRLLKAERIIFAGIDLIHGHLNEVNVTSPTLIREYLKVSGTDLGKTLVDNLEAKVKVLAR